MKKSIIISAIIVLFILGTVIGIILIKNSSDQAKETKIAESNNEVIYDECTDEYEEMVEKNTLTEEASSEGEKYLQIVQLYLEDITMIVDIQ